MHGMQTERRAPLTNRPRYFFVASATIVFALDLVTKNWAVSSLQYREPIRVIGDFLKFTYSTNKGAAFNIADNATIGLSIVKLCVATFLIYYIRKVTSVWWGLALGLLCGGVIGNLWDRITRAPGRWGGEVVDWIELPHWPIFNIADSCIVVSAVFITILAMRNIPPRGTK